MFFAYCTWFFSTCHDRMKFLICFHRFYTLILAMQSMKWHMNHEQNGLSPLFPMTAAVFYISFAEKYVGFLPSTTFSSSWFVTGFFSSTERPKQWNIRQGGLFETAGEGSVKTKRAVVLSSQAWRGYSDFSQTLLNVVELANCKTRFGQIALRTLVCPPYDINIFLEVCPSFNKRERHEKPAFNWIEFESPSSHFLQSFP